MVISCDDAGASDVRLAALCEKYNIACIFYWPVDWHSLAHSKGYKPLDYQDALKIADKFEIGSHTITHRHLTNLPEEEAKYEIEQSKEILEDMFNVDIKKFCPPRGYTNDLLTEFTLRFYEKQRLTKGEDLVHIHPNSGANDNMPWEIAAIQKRGPSPPFNDIELWCHSWELDKFNLWEELEEFLHGRN